MKKLLLVFALISISLTQAQDSKNVTMNSELAPYVQQLIDEGEERGFYIKSLIVKKIDYIIVEESLRDGPHYGVVSTNGRDIYISPDALRNKIILRLTIIHEIGHVLKGDDSHACGDCNEIMSGISPEDESLFVDGEFWEERLDNYFKWLNE